MQHPDDGLLHEWLDHELSPEVEAEVAAHVAGCASCALRAREERAALLVADNLLSELDTPAARPVLPAQPREHGTPMVLVPGGVVGGLRRTGRMRRLAVAATLVVTAGAGWLAFHSGTPETRTATSILSDAPVSVVPDSPASPGAVDSTPDHAQESTTAAPPVQTAARTVTRDEPTVSTEPAAGRAAGEARADFGPPALAAVSPRSSPEAAKAERREPDLSAPSPEPVTELRARQAERPPLSIEQDAGISTRIGLDEAREQLGGNLHVIDGLQPEMIGLVPGRLVAGADSARPVVRVVYLDSEGRAFFLDQQRIPVGFVARQAVTGPPDSWRKGDVQLQLHGALSEDSLRGLARRVR